MSSSLRASWKRHSPTFTRSTRQVQTFGTSGEIHAAASRDIPDPNAEKILQLTGDFDAAWREQFATYMGDERKEHIDNVVANRNQIAHGANIGITYMRASNYFSSADEVVVCIENLCTA
jgi:hypothetical protein